MTDRARRFALLGTLTAVAAGLGAYLVTSTPDVVSTASADSGQPGVQLVQVFQHIKLQQPVWMEQAPGSERWYVLEQPGRVVSFPNDPNTKQRAVVLDITDRVKDGGERGLLGLAFHPKFADNGRLFLSYTTMKDGQLTSRVSRFDRAEGLKFNEASESVVLEVEQPYGNHNGGQISFGPDGKLYVALGDGGSAGDPDGNGQNKDTLLGTILRIDVDAKQPYAIPSDNPFVSADGAPEIWAWGLRNPWRFSFDTKTGELWTGDVGQNAYEEINVITRGGNYGWAVREATHCYDAATCTKEGMIEPVTEYSQRAGDRSVTGGYVYRGTKWKSRIGKYIFADFVSGRIWAFDPVTKKQRLLKDTSATISSFVQAKDGEIGILDYGPGRIFHLRGE